MNQKDTLKLEMAVMDALKQRPMTPKELLGEFPQIHPRRMREITAGLRDCGNVYKVSGSHRLALSIV